MPVVLEVPSAEWCPGIVGLVSPGEEPSQGETRQDRKAGERGGAQLNVWGGEGKRTESIILLTDWKGIRAPPVKPVSNPLGPTDLHIYGHLVVYPVHRRKGMMSIIRLLMLSLSPSIGPNPSIHVIGKADHLRIAYRSHCSESAVISM